MRLGGGKGWILGVYMQSSCRRGLAFKEIRWREMVESHHGFAHPLNCLVLTVLWFISKAMWIGPQQITRSKNLERSMTQSSSFLQFQSLIKRTC